MAKRKKQQEESILDILRLLLSGLSRTALVVIAVVAVLLVAGAAFVYWLLGSNNASVATKENVELSPTQIERIKAIGQWEFLTVSDEELVDTVRHGFFGDDELVRIYTGTLRLGIDMADVEEDWIRTDGDTLRVLLPPVRLLDTNFIDEASARSFYESGRWTQADRKALARKARQKMLARCLTPQNIASAEQNATAQFHQMLRAMGFPYVSIRFRR
ncbi:MAG: DUF4230 domain-containing protein [Bacteroidaceae bacterium]|nr:DUF4230 domain-containing protein [Bacteroidaceae bacterium]